MLHSLYQKRNKEAYLGCQEAADVRRSWDIPPDYASRAAKPDMPKPSMTAADISEVIEPSRTVLPISTRIIKHSTHA